MDKPSLPKGTRDFGPVQMAKRQHILNTIRKVFETYGFQPLETPAMENMTTLSGKYGEEGDGLLFSVIDSGEALEKLKARLSEGKKTARIKDAIYDFLKFLSRDIFNKLTADETRDLRKIISIYESFSDIETHAATLYLKQNEREIISSYFKAEKVYLCFELENFFHLANLYPDNFGEKFDHHFRQFRDVTLNKLILPRVLEFFTTKELKSEIAEKGLRYDLTVPFARYVVMNRHEVVLPFKRYQIQPVWRADRPQRGRYREFYQCDADVVGTDSLVCETEIILMIMEVFTTLKISNYEIKINHRGILSELYQLSGATGNENSLFVSLDKLDKTDEKSVRQELASKGFDENGIDSLFTFLNFKGSNKEKLSYLQLQFHRSKDAVNELDAIFSLLSHFGSTDEHVQLDLSLARGLSYYTGTIFEVKVKDVTIGSVTGGGRYDNLLQAFGSTEKLSGVGISFGVDRIYDVMEELKLFPDEVLISSKVLVCHFDEASQQAGFKTVQRLRMAGIAAEVYPDRVKPQKQLDYANKKNIAYAIVIGSDELKTGNLAFKEMETGKQVKLKIEQIIKKLTPGKQVRKKK